MFRVNGKYLRALIMRKNWSLGDFKRATSLNGKTCRKMLQGGKVSVKALDAVALAFGIEPMSLVLA